MSSRLSHEIAKLASEARHWRVHDQGIIKELTMVVGFGHLAEMYPSERFYSDALRKHLQRFMDLACGHEHPMLCKHSQCIVQLLDVIWPM
jgi:hypothetical protein